MVVNTAVQSVSCVMYSILEGKCLTYSYFLSAYIKIPKTMNVCSIYYSTNLKNSIYKYSVYKIN